MEEDNESSPQRTTPCKGRQYPDRKRSPLYKRGIKKKKVFMGIEIGEIIAKAINPVTKMIDDLTTTKEEKLILKNKLFEMQSNLSKTVISAKKDIMVEELKQDDLYTKRARPTLIYGGLIILFINYVLLPWVAWFSMYFGGKEIILPTINFPSEFWIAWGGAVGVYAFRRTTEKVDQNKKGNKDG